MAPDLNSDVDPSELGQLCGRKVWWRCRDCQHVWQTSPHERTASGRGCPACGRRRIIAACVERGRADRVPPERSVAVIRPDLVAKWHATRNGDLDPAAVGTRSERRVWWRCSIGDCGREWQAVVADRTKSGGLGCPRCSVKRAGQRHARAEPDRSLAALHSHLLDEWHPTRNGDLDPFTVKPGSERRLWWRCAYCGRDWQAPPQSRQHTKLGGCPTCAIRMARGVKLERRTSSSRAA